MQHQLTAASRAAAHRRRAAALAIAALFAASGAVQAFDIDTGNPDFRSAGTTRFRYNIGMRAASQDARSSAARTSTTATAISTRARSSPTASTCCPSSTSSTSATGLSRQRRGLVDNAYSHLDNRNNATANKLVNGLPSRRSSDYTKRYAKGVRASSSTSSRSPTSTLGDAPVNIKLGQHTVYWGDSLLLGGAIHGISYGQNPIDVWKGFATPGAKPRNFPAARGFNVQAQPPRTSRSRLSVSSTGRPIGSRNREAI